MESGFRVTTARWVGVVLAGAIVIVAACPVGSDSDDKTCEEIGNKQGNCITGDVAINAAIETCKTLTKGCKGAQKAFKCILAIGCDEGGVEAYAAAVADCYSGAGCKSDPDPDCDGGTCCDGGGCGDPGDDGGPDAGPQCAAAPTTNTCADANHPVQCHSGCCPQGLLFTCAEGNRCYATEAEAKAACPNSCEQCNPVPPVACQPAPTTNSCPNADHPHQCHSGCCEQGFPFLCPGRGCYATQVEARAACPDSCEACDPNPPTACQAAPTTNSCPNADHPHQCHSGCCERGFPFLCPGRGCYATQAEARAACPDSCEACTQLITLPAPLKIGSSEIP